MPPMAGAAFAAEAVDVGWCKLTVVDDPKYTVICELGDGPPLVIQGYGGWDEVDRQGRTALTSWRGFKPVGISLPLFLDDHAEGRSIETAMAILEAMAGRGERRASGQPPALAVETAGVMPHDFHASDATRWVIETLDVDADSVIVNDYGNWTRAAVTVTLLQYVTDDGLVTRSEAVRNRILASAPVARRSHTVKTGETAVSIARSELGDAGRWREITALNGLRDPRARLKVGSQLRLPARR